MSEIIGYQLVHTTDPDIDIKNILWCKRILYTTWLGACKAAKKIIDSEADSWGVYHVPDADISEKNMKKCHKGGEFWIYGLTLDGGQSINVSIVPVYRGD
jgi:hypothetical protein